MGHYFLDIYYTVCPRSSDPSYGVTYYIKWVTNSWTYSLTQKDQRYCSVPNKYTDLEVKRENILQG